MYKYFNWTGKRIAFSLMTHPQGSLGQDRKYFNWTGKRISFSLPIGVEPRRPRPSHKRIIFSSVLGCSLANPRQMDKG